MQSSYEALQQRRERIDFALGDGACQPFTRCIRALLDKEDEECRHWLEVVAEDSVEIQQCMYAAYDRALSIAEKELGL